MRKLIVYSLASLILVSLLCITALAEALPTPKYFEAQWGLINPTGTLVLKQVYTDLGQLVDGLAPVQLGDKQGYLNLKGEVVIKPQYTFADVFSEGLARVNVGGEFDGQYPSGGKWGFINNKGRYVVEPKYDWAEAFSDGLAKVIENGEIKYLNKQGYVELDLGNRYTDSGNFSGGFTWVRTSNGDYFFMDQRERVNPNIIWRTIPGSFSGGLASVSEQGKDGYVNTELQLVIPYRYEVGGSFSEGRARVRDGGKWGFIDYNGTVVIPCEYEFVEDFSDGLALVWVNDKAGYINTRGQFVIQPRYDDALSFSGGLAAVYENGTGWGFVNAKGFLVTPQAFADARSFSGGVARVATAAGWGYVNEIDEVVIPPQFEEAHEFAPVGLAQVVQAGQPLWINKTGEVIIRPKYSGHSGWVNELLIASDTSEWKPAEVVFYRPDGSSWTFADWLQQDQVNDTYLLPETYSVLATGLNMRKSADLQAEKVMTIPYGAEVKVLERTDLALSVEGIAGHWARVEYEGQQGYVYDGFLTRLPAPTLNVEKNARFSIKDYAEQHMRNIDTFELSFEQHRIITIKISESGITMVEGGIYGDAELWVYLYLPGLSVREAFLLQRIIYAEEVVTCVNGQALSEETRLKDLNMPDGRQITLEFAGDWVLTIEEGEYGYAVISSFPTVDDSM